MTLPTALALIGCDVGLGCSFLIGCDVIYDVLASEKVEIVQIENGIGCIFCLLLIFILSKSHLAFYVCLTFGFCGFFFPKRIMEKLKRKDDLNHGFE